MEAEIDFRYEKPPQERRFPVVEVFGPTIQGEGPDQGTPCFFVRFGGCDFACSWCDTPHAVLPESVRRAAKMNASEIAYALKMQLAPGPKLVVLSGGNPGLLKLMPVIRRLHDNGYRLSVETQGTRWANWMWHIERLVVSPKPPSSGMKQPPASLDDFLSNCKSSLRGPWVALKVVVFDQSDYEYAQAIHKRFPNFPFYISAGNDAGATVGNPSRVDDRNEQQVAEDLLIKYRWLVNRVMVDPLMQNAQVQSQQHVLLWGNRRGV